MTRIFVYDGREFPDPDPGLSVEDVRRQLSDFFPELTNAETREERRGEHLVGHHPRQAGRAESNRGGRARRSAGAGDALGQ